MKAHGVAGIGPSKDLVFRHSQIVEETQAAGLLVFAWSFSPEAFLTRHGRRSRHIPAAFGNSSVE